MDGAMGGGMLGRLKRQCLSIALKTRYCEDGCVSFELSWVLVGGEGRGLGYIRAMRKVHS